MPSGEHFKGKKPTNTPKGPSTKAEVDLRVMQVGKLLIQGYQRFEIVAVIGDKYSVSPSQVNDYMVKARAIIRAKNEQTLEEEQDLVEQQIMDIYTNARREKKYGDATRALQMKMSLRGLEAPKKINLSGGLNITDVVNNGDTEARAFLHKKSKKS